MPNYLSPGVYVEEVEAGSRPIEGVGTAVAAFVGLAAQGPFNTPTLVTNWTQFTSTFGDFVEGSYLAARRVRLLRERRRSLLRRPDRRGRRGSHRACRADERHGQDPGVVPHQRPRSRPDRQRHPGRSLGCRRPATTTRSPSTIREQRVRGEVREGHDQEGQAERRHARQRAVEADPARGDRQGGRGRAQAGGRQDVALGRRGRGRDEPQPGRLHRQLGRPHRHRRSRGDRPGDDGLRPGPDVRVPEGPARLRGGQGRPAGDDHALRADGRPRRDPRSAAGPQRPADPRVARRPGGLRLEVRHALLAVGQGLRPRDGQERVHAPERS